MLPRNGSDITFVNGARMQYLFGCSDGGKTQPSRLIEGFGNAALHADGYAAYNQVCRENNITGIGCWDSCTSKVYGCR